MSGTRQQTVIHDAELSVWYQSVDRPDFGDPDDPPDAVIPAEKFDQVGIEARADEILDEASLTVDHPGYDGDYDLSLGDRVRYDATVAGEGETYYGEGIYGEGLYGGAERDIQWTGRIRPTNRGRDQIGSEKLDADGTDFVGGILAERNITGTWIDTDVGEIIRDICEQKASEVDASGIPDLGVTTDQFFQSRNAWDAITTLAAKGDVILYEERNQLLADPITELTPQFELQPSDHGLPFDVQTDDDCKNVIRVDSGVTRQLETSQETVDSWTRVTDTNRITHRVPARKSQIHSVDLYVSDADNSDDIRVRVQADDGGGAPVDPGNEDSDIVAETVKSDNLPGEGWATIFLPDHTLPPRGDPWLLIEATGSDGHDVGVDANGVPTFRSHYPHPLNFEASDSESIAKYGARDDQVEKKNLETLVATRDAAKAELARRAYPGKTVTFPARSARCHALEPGDMITIPRPEDNADGEFIVAERSQTFDAERASVETVLTLTWRKGIFAPQ